MFAALLLEDAGDLSSGAKQEKTDAGCCEPSHLRDFAVRVVFRMGQPEQLSIARAHTCERGLEEGCGVHLLG